MVPRFIGTIRRSIKMLSTYSFWLGWALGLQIALDAFLLYAYFTTPREDLVRNCVKDSTDQNVINSCNSAFNVGKGAMIGGVVVNLLIQACAYPVPSPPISIQDLDPDIVRFTRCCLHRILLRQEARARACLDFKRASRRRL